MHQYLFAKLKVFTKNATDNSVVMTNKELNSLLPKWVEEQLEMIDLGQDNEAQVVFSIVVSNLNLHLIKFRYESWNFTFTHNILSSVQACNVLIVICLFFNLFGFKIQDSRL